MLERHVWEQLVMEHIQAFTDKPHAREDLALACRQVNFDLPQAHHFNKKTTLLQS